MKQQNYKHIALAGLHLRGAGGTRPPWQIFAPPWQNFKLKSQIHQQQLLNACVCGGYCVLYIRTYITCITDIIINNYTTYVHCIKFT